MSLDNSICVSTPEQCPITFLSFVANTDLSSYPQSSYTRIPFDTGSGGFNLVYGKNYDALPVTSTLVENQPCLVDGVTVGNAFSLLENSRYKSCPQEPLTKMYYDPRYYTTTGFSKNEFEVRTENLVLTKLVQDTQGYNKQENVPDVNVMKQFTLRAWTKSVTPWSLQCESLGMSRNKAHAMFSTELSSNHHPKQAASAAMGLWITLIPLYLVAFTGLCFRKAFYFGFYTSRLVLLVCLSMIIHHLSLTLVIVNNATR